MDEQSKQDDVNAQCECTGEDCESSRREFMSKLVTSVGVAAVAGLASTAANAAVGDQSIKIDSGKIESPADVVNLKFGKFRNGFRLSMSGRQIGEALKQAGIARSDANLDAATLTIEFTA